MGERLEVAREILQMASEELERGRRLNQNFLLRNAADKAFLAVVQAVNDVAKARLGKIPLNHGERRRFLRDVGREDLRAEYSDLMRDLREDCFYTGIIDEEVIDAAFKKAGDFVEKIEELEAGEPRQRE